MNPIDRKSINSDVLLVLRKAQLLIQNCTWPGEGVCSLLQARSVKWNSLLSDVAKSRLPVNFTA